MLERETRAELVTQDAHVPGRSGALVATLPNLVVTYSLPEASWFESGAPWSVRRVPLHVIARACGFTRALVQAACGTEGSCVGDNRGTTARGICRGRRPQPAASAAVHRHLPCGATGPGVQFRRPTGARGRGPSAWHHPDDLRQPAGCALRMHLCGQQTRPDQGETLSNLKRRVARFAC
jgi:hypothetical protein